MQITPELKSDIARMTRSQNPRVRREITEAIKSGGSARLREVAPTLNLNSVGKSLLDDLIDSVEALEEATTAKTASEGSENVLADIAKSLGFTKVLNAPKLRDGAVEARYATKDGFVLALVLEGETVNWGLVDPKGRLFAAGKLTGNDVSAIQKKLDARRQKPMPDSVIGVPEKTSSLSARVAAVVKRLSRHA